MSKVPRHFLTFQEDALRDINLVDQEKYDVSDRIDNINFNRGK
jgi:hypothetical protein